MEVFYLKLNQDRGFAYDYLRMWIDQISAFENPMVYVHVDNPRIEKIIREHIDFMGVRHEFIKSRFDDLELKPICDTFRGRFGRVGYAMLTTFVHAKEQGYKDYYNIDADDIGLYVSPAKLVQIFAQVKSYAQEHKIQIFSLDALQSYHSIAPQRDWTFGVAYTNNTVDWIKIMSDHCNDTKYTSSRFFTTNLDRYVGSYLSNEKLAKVATFYVENLYVVINHHEDMIHYPAFGLRHWKDGRLWFDFICNELGMGEEGSIKISDTDMVKFDVGLTTSEGKSRLRETALKTKDVYMKHLFGEKFMLANFVDKMNDIIPPPP